MKNYKILFNNLEWEKPSTGVELKIVSDGTRSIRLLRFYDDFIENEWCTNGHVGYVLDGEMSVDFNGRLEHYRKGDGLWIEDGVESKHKALIAKGKYVELILFEEVKK